MWEQLKQFPTAELCEIKWSYILSPVTWGFITKTITLIGTSAEESTEGEESWRLSEVQPTRLPLRCPLLKATDKTHYTAAVSWNVIPSIDQTAPLPRSTVTFHNLGAGVGGSIINTHTCTHREKYVINFNSNIFIMLPFLKCTIYLILLRLFSCKFWENTLERKLLNQNFHDNMNEARNGVSLINLMFLNSIPDFFFL